MSDWSYCMHCRQGLDAPSLGDVLRGLRICPNVLCSAVLDVRNEPGDAADAADALLERVEELERKLASLLPPAPPPR